jgi:DNA end-binding protein Ku
MRTTWNGSVSFGLVNIPVGLSPIQQKRWCPVHDVEVGPDELVRGWEVSKGQFVPVEDSELEAIERQDTSRTIEITRFVKLDEVDPVYFDRTYYLVPAGTEAQRRPYVLLLEAMKQSEVAALGSFVLAGKEKLCLIRAKGDALALETLFVSEDVKSQAEIDEAVATAEVRDPELELARQIIASLEAAFDPAELRSDYRASLRELLQAKLEGQEIVAPEPAAVEAPVVDLMEALRASVAASKKEPREKKAPARKGAASSRR